MEKLVVDCPAIAYHFLIHSMVKNHNAKFSDNDLRNFISDFKLYANGEDYELIDSSGEELTEDKVFDEIVCGFVGHRKDMFGDKYAYFRLDVVELMRKSYQFSENDYKDLVTGFEEMLASRIYNQTAYYLTYEDYYKRDAKMLEGEGKKTFDA